MFLRSPAVANLENALSLKISSNESSKTSRQFCNSETSSKPENCLNFMFSSSLITEIFADHADKNKRISETLQKKCHLIKF